jgi:hypothetical protein
VVLWPKKNGNLKKKLEKTVKEPKIQILCHEIEPNPSKDRAFMREIILHFEMNL